MNKAQHKLKEIEAALTTVAGRWQKRHGGELPPGALTIGKPLTAKEELADWAKVGMHASRAERDGIERRTPADELAAKELRLGIHEPEPLPLFEGFESDRRATPFEELDEKEEEVTAEGEEAMRIWMEAHAWMLDFLFAEGPHPAAVMRRLYAWVKKFRPQSIWDMGYRQLGTLLCESHGAMEWRIGVLLDDYARAKGVNGVKAPWQRTAEACSNYSEAQQGNGNRMGGNKSAKTKSRKFNRKERKEPED